MGTAGNWRLKLRLKKVYESFGTSSLALNNSFVKKILHFDEDLSRKIHQLTRIDHAKFISHSKTKFSQKKPQLQLNEPIKRQNFHKNV